MNHPNLKKGKALGFTLVEMAIVLVIIGIILAGVMKGRDIVRGAQVKQFSQQFAQKWASVAQTYYDKTGRFLNDGETNGGTASTTADGQMDGSAPVRAQDIVDVCEAVGITPCSLVKSKIANEYGTATTGPFAVETGHCGTATDGGVNIFETLVEGEYAGNQRVVADLISQTVQLAGDTTKLSRRNCIALYNVPTDVAIGLDTAIDGNADGANGALVNIIESANGAPITTAYTSLTTTRVAAAWPSATDGSVHLVLLLMDY